VGTGEVSVSTTRLPTGASGLIFRMSLSVVLSEV
jgi:hypothetical protein